MASFFWTTTNSFAYNARRMGSWATMWGECREYSRRDLSMLLIDSQLVWNIQILLRLRPKLVCSKEYHAQVVRKANVWDTHRRYTPPCPLQTHFPRPNPEGKNYIPSQQYAPIKIFTIFFFRVIPISFRWHHSLIVSTMFSYWLICYLNKR